MPIHFLVAAYSLSVHCLFVAVRCLLTVCSLYVHCMFTLLRRLLGTSIHHCNFHPSPLCTALFNTLRPPIHCLFAAYSLACAQPVHCLFTACSLSVHSAQTIHCCWGRHFTTATSTLHSHASPLCTAYSIPSDRLFTVCSLRTHCLFTACSLCSDDVLLLGRSLHHCKFHPSLSRFTALYCPIHCLFAAYSLPVHCLFTACSLPTHCMFTVCSLCLDDSLLLGTSLRHCSFHPSYSD
jgi:hypothetical protein